MKYGIECKRCGDCCRRYPCSLVPDDLINISNYLNLSPLECFKKFLVIDYWEAQKPLYYVCPARTDGIHGKIVSSQWAFSGTACIFLKDNLCQIHPVKPHCGFFINCKNDNHRYNKLWYAKLWENTNFIEILRQETP